MASVAGALAFANLFALTLVRDKDSRYHNLITNGSKVNISTSNEMYFVTGMFTTRDENKWAHQYSPNDYNQSFTSNVIQVIQTNHLEQPFYFAATIFFIACISAILNNSIFPPAPPSKGIQNE